MSQHTIIRLTESDLHRIIKNSVFQYLKEEESIAPADNEYITDAIEALEELSQTEGIYITEGGTEEITLCGNLGSYAVEFTGLGADNVEGTYDVPGTIDMHNFQVRVTSVIFSDTYGDDQDMTTFLAKPLQNSLEKHCTVEFD